jgi:ribosomal protein S28E/S33
MPCKSTEFLSFRQIADQYRGTGTVATWRCRLRRNTRDLRAITRKVGGSVRIERRDLERYIRG